MNNAFRFNTDTATAHLIRQAALRQGRSVADVIRRAIEQHVDHAPSVIGDDSVVISDEGPRRHGTGRITGCYLSNPLASIVRDIAAQEGHSHSNVVGGLIRESLQRRGLLPTPSAAAVNTPSPKRILLALLASFKLPVRKQGSSDHRDIRPFPCGSRWFFTTDLGPGLCGRGPHGALKCQIQHPMFMNFLSRNA